MATDYHTAISTGAAANAATVETPLAALDAAIGLGGGGANATATVLRAWAGAEAFRASSITRNANGVVTDATVTWPDGSSGTLETTYGYPAGSATPDTTEAGWVASQITTITHADSSQTATVTITRNSSAVPTAITIGVA
jgi:hypothetical protein